MKNFAVAFCAGMFSQDLIFTAGQKENLEMAKISSRENF